MNRCVLPVVMSALIGLGNLPIALAASSEPQLNFKIYSPESNDSAKEEATTAPAETPAPAAEAAAPAPAAEATMPAASTDSSPPAADAAPAPASSQGYTPPAAEAKAAEAAPDASTSDAPTLRPEAPTPAADASTPAAESKSSLQAETPTEAPAASTAAAPTKTDDSSSTEAKAGTMNGEAQTSSADSSGTDDTKKAEGGEKTEKTADGKALQGYIRVVPEGTKIPIIMDTAVDSDTSQEGDEFTARTSEDLNIDGAVAVPAGSIIKGRIAQMNAPKHLDRSGSVALKFDTVTTPDNRQIPLVANLVSHGGVVHARRGLKDIAIDSSTVLIPTLVGLAIGAIAGKSNSSTSTSTTSTSTSSITKPEAAMIGVGIGLAVGVAILCAKKGKKVDVRPGDELKIQLSEELRMPMM